MFRTIITMVAGFLISFSSYSQPLSVDQDTLALWNFESDVGNFVIDSSPNEVNGNSRASLVTTSPIGLGKARYFPDHFSVILFPVPSSGSPLDILAYPNWTLEFSLSLDRPTPDTMNIFNNGQVGIEVQGSRLTAYVQKYSSKYGVKAEQSFLLNTTYKIRVVFQNNVLSLIVNGKVWASQSLDPEKKKTNEILNPRQQVLLGGTPREPLVNGAVGLNHGCVISQIGSINCWGDNSHGQLGRGNFGGHSSLPYPPYNLINVSAVSAGNKFTCAKGGDDNEILCWGTNSQLEIGSSLFPQIYEPFAIMSASNVTALDSGSSHSCVLMTDKKLKCWGRNQEGQLGIGMFSSASEPVVNEVLTDIESFSAGGNHTCAIVTGGNVFCWGSNSDGQLGNSGPDTFVPTQVNGIIGATRIATGLKHSCALFATGEVKCWGANSFGQLGNGQTTSSSFPSVVSGIAPDTARSISLGDNYSCANLNSTRVKCWGSNSHNQLGRPSSLSQSTTAIDSGIALILTNFVVSGARTNCVQRVQTFTCYGSNETGALGRGLEILNSTEFTAPVLVLKQGHVTGYLDEVRVSSSARQTVRRPKITLASSTSVSTATPTIAFDIDSVDGIDPLSLTVTLNGSISGGLQVSGNQITGQLDTDLNPGRNSIELSLKDNSGSLGKLKAEISYLISPDGLLPHKVFTGSTNSCYLNEVGDVYCWGSNQHGQLGTQTGVYSSSPVKNSWMKNVTDLAIAQHSICALDASKEVWCWGQAGAGLSGTGNRVSRSFPERVLFTKPVEKIYSGALSFCAHHDDFSLSCWGVNTEGALGDTNNILEFPTTVATDVRSMSMSEGHQCVINESDGAVRCRGRNAFGQLGDNTLTANKNFVNVSTLGNQVEELSLSEATSCARTGVEIKCWGANFGYQFGRGSPDPYFPYGSKIPVSTTIVPNSQNINLGDGFACSLNNGSLFCWGANSRGEIGNGSAGVPLPGGYTHGLNITSVSVSGGTICAIDDQKDVYCWGSNPVGQAGSSNTLPVKSPHKLIEHTFNTSAVLSNLQAGEGNTCMKVNGLTHCWGSTNQGQFGRGESTRYLANYPEYISALPDISETSVGYGHICHISNGNVFCAGNNSVYQSSPISSERVTSYTQAVLPFPALKVRAARDFTCALLTNQTVWCWGANFYGQIGVNSQNMFFPNPTQVATISGVTDLYSSGLSQHTCARTSAGKVWCWGRNDSSQIGSSSASTRAPYNVIALDTSTMISTGSNTTCGLSSSGEITCRLLNNAGQAGTNDDFSNWGSNPVSSNSIFTNVKSGTEHVCGLTSDLALYCWGKGTFGQVGHGVYSNVVKLPRKILTDVKEFSLGGDHTCAITNDNRLWCWGFNENGQFGNGSNNNTNVPEVSDFKN